MKNILIITGSPRKNGNSTLLANAFIEGTQKAGHNNMLFEAGRKKINNCLACDTCQTKKKGCVFNDDFSHAIPLLEKADVIVFATPLYWFTFTAQLKAFMDRMYALDFEKMKIKEAVMMVCAATDKTEDYDGIVKTYEIMLDYLGWENRGALIAPSVTDVGDILKTDALARAKELGLSI